MNNVITFRVGGLPVSQGSSRAFIVKEHVIITSANRNLKTWRDSVALVAQQYAPQTLMDGPVVISLAFVLPRPKSLPKKKRMYPDKRPDLDKLIRAILDALTNIIYRDDCQVVNILASKDYDYTQPPGVLIAITEKEEMSLSGKEEVK